MIDLSPQEKWVVERAIGHLRWDDAHPNVGMGMFYGTAITMAMDDAIHAAEVFAGGAEFFLLHVDKDKIMAEVILRRANR